MALVLLKTGIIHPGDPGAQEDATGPVIDNTQMSTAQKLLLFWRKPAVRPVWACYLNSGHACLLDSESAGGTESRSTCRFRALRRR